MNNIDKMIQTINAEIVKEAYDIDKLNKLLTISKAVYAINLKHYLDNKLTNENLIFPTNLKQLKMKISELNVLLNKQNKLRR
jgi:hypothetical protein